MRTIAVRRRRGYYGMARLLRLLVDDVEVGALKQTEILRLQVSDEARTLVGVMDWGRTAPFVLSSVPDGATLEIGTAGGNLREWFGIGGLPFRIRLAEA